MWRGIVVSLALTVGGCALPPALSWASLALDGLSFAATGKSSTDHVLSVLAGQDCATWRVLHGLPVCEARGEAVLAFADVRLAQAHGASVTDAMIRDASGVGAPPPRYSTVVCVSAAGFCATVDTRKERKLR